MDSFFENLCKTNSVEKAKESLMVVLKRRKLDLAGEEVEYEQIKKEFDNILKMERQNDILSKIFSNKAKEL